MDIEELLNILKTSNLKLVSRDTGIPNDRMYKWKQGKGRPKKEDFDTLVNYFTKGKSSDKLDKIGDTDTQPLIDSLRDVIKSKDETIEILRDQVRDLKQRLSQYEGQQQTGTH